ncbi:MAG: zinc ribbon domain-containing protein [Elusimicrobia bacterium]|nr:zinc ribbon domain-containing protein [Elusimicrobiota bacterium]
MSSIAFTKNYTDHSNNQGYQFEFHCDKCGNGFRSSYAANKLGIATSFLGAAADMFGGAFGQAARAGDHLKDAMRGKAWDSAFAGAIEEIKPRFRQCRRCGHWICPEVCWNEPASMCKQCAPDLTEEKAAAQADALKSAVASQLQKKAQDADLVGDMDVSKQSAAACPHCRAALSGGKFCPECGKPVADPSACSKCKAPLAGGSKFCAECGAPR